MELSATTSIINSIHFEYLACNTRKAQKEQHEAET